MQTLYHIYARHSKKSSRQPFFAIGCVGRHQERDSNTIGFDTQEDQGGEFTGSDFYLV